MRALRAVLFGFAALLVAAAVNHAVLAARGEGDVVRHEVFVGIDAAAAVLVAASPRWAVYPVALLAAQQALSHGGDLVASIQRGGPFDWASLGVLVFFPALVIALVIERRRRAGRTAHR